jgi:DNA-binding beta-propeller fold protein YncE
MKNNANSYRKIIAMIAVALLAAGITRSSLADSLYVGDAGDNTVKRFDATSGAFPGVFVKRSDGGLHGPAGLIFNQTGDLELANQNVNLGTSGEILIYDGATGKYAGALVPNSDPNAPFAPRGIVFGNQRLFVASQQEKNDLHQLADGRLWVYTAEGEFISGLNAPPGLVGQFHPRGVVFGPDGLLYVSNTPIPGGLHAQILRYDPKEIAFKDVFVDDLQKDLQKAGVSFNRPEGLVFGPDGNLYVTSFRTDVNDNDKILIFADPGSKKAGAFLGKIDLDKVGDPRTYAQALLFGPNGKLYVPISNTGQIRVYNASTKEYSYTELVAPASSGGLLTAPQYLTFGKTDPATLAYPTQ